eukprot:CAMPEP_0198223070 /NCGR_PEP_ID=MMETSP1445-20131203/90847_1 /TAXON_ID=36898 /ORGANISM="Pyramimonas sp., Strain CCMP2087" /LENGTH=53 /DNA_ID=CAMNT_0043901799 /DNA_START=51 /DNA_END=208 /DNA_ORIENTATION=-
MAFKLKTGSNPNSLDAYSGALTSVQSYITDEYQIAAMEHRLMAVIPQLISKKT